MIALFLFSPARGVNVKHGGLGCSIPVIPTKGTDVVSSHHLFMGSLVEVTGTISQRCTFFLVKFTQW